LTLVNSTVWSNYPLPFYVANGGTLVTSRGSASRWRPAAPPACSAKRGPLERHDLRHGDRRERDLFGGSGDPGCAMGSSSGLWIDTVQTTHLRDATSRASRPSPSRRTTEREHRRPRHRNTTFNQVQTSQLVFGGTQNVQLTSVQTFDPSGSWWVGMITGGAR